MVAPRTNAGHDQNRVATLIGVSTTDGITPIPVEVDPTNGQLQVSSTGGGGGGDGAILDGVTSSIKATVLDLADSNPIAVAIVNTSGDQVSVGGGTQYAEDSASADGEQVTMAGVVRKDTRGTMVSTDGDRTELQTNASGDLRVDGSAVTQPVSQGTSAALTGGWPTINGEIGDVTGTFTNATQTISVTATSLDGYGNTLISINGTFGTATAVFEGSDDGGTTWYPVQAARDNSNVIELGYTSLTNTNQTWQINNPGFDSLRVRSTAVASGTVNVRLSSSAAPVASGTIIGLGTAIPAGSALIGKVGIDQTTPGTTNLVALAANQSVNNAQVSGTTVSVNNGTTDAGTQRVTLSSDSTGQVKLAAGTNAIGTVNLSPTASGGWTPYFANAITTTVAPTAAAGKFGGYMLINLNSAPAYLQVFDTTGAVTLGTTAPTFVIPIPANSTAANGLAANVELANGIVIANGIKCAATTTATGASTVSTGLSGTLWVK